MPPIPECSITSELGAARCDSPTSPPLAPARALAGVLCLHVCLAAGAFAQERGTQGQAGQAIAAMPSPTPPGPAAGENAGLAGPAAGASSAAPEQADQEVSVPHPELFKLARVTVKELDTRVRTSGSVTWDVNLAVPIFSIAGGRAVDVRAKLGDEVKKDQILVVVDSPDMVGALADHRKAVSAQALAQKSLARVKYMFDHEAAPQKDYEQAVEDLHRSAVDLAACRERIRLMGGRPDQKTPTIEVRAPIGGWIVEQNVVQGAAVRSLDSSVNLFTVADLSRVWLMCDLYENNLADVNVGALAEVEFTAFPGRKFEGRVGQISKVLDPATRAAKVRVEMENADGALRPGMFARAKFMSVKAIPNTMVPSSAILNLHDRSWVYLHETGNRFRLMAVHTGITLKEGFVEVHGGLRPGDEVAEEALQFSAAVADTEQK